MTNEFDNQMKTAAASSSDILRVRDEAADDIEARLCRIWQEVLGLDSVGLDDNYFDLGGDSALTVQLFAQIEKAFSIKVPLPMLFEAPTVREFAGVLRSAGADQSISSLVPIQPTGSRPPFFCVHGTEGAVSIYQDLARHLSPDQPFYGLQSQGLDGKLPPLTTIENMAALYLKEIRKLQPKGPYFVGGHSMGGIIALEMAQQLQRNGEIVGLVALFDTIDWSKVPPPSVFGRAYYYYQERQFRRSSLHRSRDNKDNVVPETPALQQGSDLSAAETPSEPSVSESAVLRYVSEANIRARAGYVSRLYTGAVTDFRPVKQYRLYAGAELRWDLDSRGDQEIVTLPVYPTTMLSDPFVEYLAAGLSKALEMAISKSELCRVQLA